MNTPRIGGSIFVLILGAVLYFALNTDNAGGFSLSTIGLILLVAGGVWFVVELVFGLAGNKTRSTTTVRDAEGGTSERVTEVE